MTSVKRPRLVKKSQPLPDPPHPIDSATTLKFVSGAYYIPKQNESKPLGEDAHFFCDEYKTIGVADGVGGWARKGIDAGEYARELMSNAVFSLDDNYQAGDNVNPKLVLNEAFLNTESKGSSTACIVTLKNYFSHNYLHAVNVGDSGFVVVRDDKIVYRSPIQQGGFNCPYQLGNSCYSDSPDSAMELVFPVVAGDIVLVGTDGLFDNVYDNEIVKVLKSGMTDPEMLGLPELFAWLIAWYALQRAEDETYFSPFEKAAQEAGVRHVGGKYDDITVVVAFVRPADESDF